MRVPRRNWTRLAATVTAALALSPAAAAQDAQPEPAEGRGCLDKRDGVQALSIRGVRVGARARITGPDGRPLKASSVSYCARGGGDVAFALDPNDDVVLVTSTSSDDMTGDPGAVGPGSPSWAARAVFPQMRRHYRSPSIAIYRAAPTSQVVLGLWDGEVRFVGVADRLLLDYRGKLGYYLKRLGW